MLLVSHRLFILLLFYELLLVLDYCLYFQAENLIWIPIQEIGLMMKKETESLHYEISFSVGGLLNQASWSTHFFLELSFLYEISPLNLKLCFIVKILILVFYLIFLPFFLFLDCYLQVFFKINFICEFILLKYFHYFVCLIWLVSFLLL